MQDIFGSVRRSLVFRPNDEATPSSPAAALADRINSCIRKSRVFSKQFSTIKENTSCSANISNGSNPRNLIRWRKGELIGCGAFGQVYMGMNLDSGELLAVKQVLITTNSASKEKAQAHLKELEEEVKLLKNLSHPNIVRYLGTVREEDTLNILLEFVPGGSISSLLGKFGAFPETVIRSYTKQLLLGLEYLHKNGIMHRDIKGANILVDNKGCIKLADFGASKQVVELATVTGAKSMKGTPYWMAPEVILQTGHSFSADIWSVGCTVIEMATGKPPWSQQYQEVAALFHIGTTKAHPPIPEHLSTEAQNFLLKCLQKEPNLRPPASELLQDPFVAGDRDSSAQPTSVMEIAETSSPVCATNIGNSQILCPPESSVVCELDNVSPSIMCPDNSARSIRRRSNGEDDMCLIDDNYDFGVGQPSCDSVPDKCFKPTCELNDGSSGSLNLYHGVINLEPDQSVHRPDGCSGGFLDKDNDSFSPYGQSLSEDDEVLTESKIRAFLDDKALELKKMQTPLFEEFYNTLNGVVSPSSAERTRVEGSNYLKLPPKSRSPSRGTVGSPSVVDTATTTTPSSSKRRLSEIGISSDQSSPDIPSSQEDGSSMSFSEIQRKWKEELDQELERQRELMRQAAGGQNHRLQKIEHSTGKERSRGSLHRDDAS